MGVSGFHESNENASPISKIGADCTELEIEDGPKSPRKSRSLFLGQKKADGPQGGEEKMIGATHQMPPASVMTRLILIMVWRKLIRNPNTYSSLIGVVWSLISFRQESSTLNITHLIRKIVVVALFLFILLGINIIKVDHDKIRSSGLSLKV